jgi:1-acyl-sn-glycerol-3-phosphate acyltransferase
MKQPSPTAPAATTRTRIGSAVYFGGASLSALVFAVLALFLIPLGFQARYRVISRWAHFNLWMLKQTCGLEFRIEGAEHIPDTTSIIYAKHQSAWETLALQKVFPPQTWVLKRELLWLPVFGWGLATLKPIAIDRKAGRKAVKAVVEQGAQRLAEGIWVVVFPEGTRIAPGQERRYRLGGAVLATQTGTPLVPVAHNAGSYWPRRGFLKRPGCIRMKIGPAIDPRGKTPQELTDEAKAWIDAAMREIAKGTESGRSL